MLSRPCLVLLVAFDGSSYRSLDESVQVSVYEWPMRETFGESKRRTFILNPAGAGESPNSLIYCAAPVLLVDRPFALVPHFQQPDDWRARPMYDPRCNYLLNSPHSRVVPPSIEFSSLTADGMRCDRRGDCLGWDGKEDSKDGQ